METTLKSLGDAGEALAKLHLEAKGYKILLRNYVSPLGEIDLVAKHRGSLVFVEVKTRRSEAMGLPQESVTLEKRRHLVRSAKYYLKRYGIHNTPCRFDVVSIVMKDEEAARIEVIENAFTENDAC